MTRTRVMSPGKGRRNADFMQSAGDNPLPWPCFASISAGTGAGTRGLLLSVERERVPGDAVPGDAVPGDAVPGDAVPRDAVPGDAIPGDAVPGDAVPGEVIPGDAIPDQGVPGEQLPENATGQRILPLQRRTKEDRVQRAGEAVRGPQSAIGTGYGSRAKERADREPTRQEPRVGRCIARHGDGGGVHIEQPAAVRYRIRENLAAPRAVRLRGAEDRKS